MKIAIFQANILFEEPEANHMKAESVVSEARNRQAELILFPEMSFSGFSMNIGKAGEWGQRSKSLIRDLAVANNIFVGFGWVNLRHDGLAENHYTIINGKGDELCDYVKIHPFSYAGEDKKFAKGGSIEYFLYKEVRISCFICYDLRFPELFRIASEHSSMIIVAANWPAQRIRHWQSLMVARAIENQVYMLGVNCVGRQGGMLYSGHSMAVNPNGDILVDCGENEELTMIEIMDDVSSFREAFPVRRDIRNDLYDKLRSEGGGMGKCIR